MIGPAGTTDPRGRCAPRLACAGGHQALGQPAGLRIPSETDAWTCGQADHKMAEKTPAAPVGGITTPYKYQELVIIISTGSTVISGRKTNKNVLCHFFLLEERFVLGNCRSF